MKDNFPGYYHNPDLNKLFDQCTFVFDANVLLALYEIPMEDAEDFFNVLTHDKIKNRIWIPHQVALEYQKNRAEVIGKQENKTNIVNNIKTVQSSVNEIEKNISQISMLQNEYLDEKVIQDYVKKIKSSQDFEVKKHDFLTNDPVRNRLDTILQNKIGSKFDDEELNNLYLEGKKRYRNKIPPGYEDSKNKDDDAKYGDLVIWKQMIVYAKNKKTPIIFITNEKKRDWIFNDSRIQGPQAELVNEFMEETGQIFHIIKLKQFLKEIKQYKILIKEKTIDHFEDISEEKKVYPSEIESGYYDYLFNFYNHNLKLDSEKMVFAKKRHELMTPEKIELLNNISKIDMEKFRKIMEIIRNNPDFFK